MQGVAHLQELEVGISELQNNLADKHQLDVYAIGTNTTPLDSFHYQDKASDYASFFQQLSDVYSYRNVAAVVLASDGLYNQGGNPLYADYPFRAPLYPIALGDTMPQKDVRISQLYHNDLAFLGNSFPLQISVQTHFCVGEKVQLSVWEGQTQLHQEELIVSEEYQRFQTQVLLSAEEVGVHRYQIRLSAVSGERNTYNNMEEVFVEILESRQKILLLTESAHPDIFALTTAIEQNDNYEVNQQFVKDFKEVFMTLSPEEVAFPRSCNNVNKYIDSNSIYKKGTPIHVKGALIYNHNIDKHRLGMKYPLIKDGDKIKFLMLKQPNTVKDTVISFSTKIPYEFELHKYVDYDTQFEKTFTDPLRFILDSIGWKLEREATLEAFFG